MGHQWTIPTGIGGSQTQKMRNVPNLAFEYIPCGTIFLVRFKGSMRVKSK